MSELIYEDEYIIRCDCKQLWDATVFTVSFDKHKLFAGTENEMIGYDLFISQNIQEVGFWERLKNCIKYLFKQRKFWNHGETYVNMLNEERIEDIENLNVFLHNACLMARKNLERMQDEQEKAKKKDDAGHG